MIIDGELYVPRKDRDAFKILIVVVCIAYAAVTLPLFERLGSPSLKAFPTPVAMVFLVGLLTCGLVALAGIIRLNPRLEGIGMFGLSGVWLAFGLMGLSTSGGRAFAFSAFLFAFSAAALWTWWQRLGRPWRAARRHRREGRDAG